MATPRQELDALAQLFAPQIRDAFLAAIQDIVDTVLLNQVIDAVQAGDVERAFRVIGFSAAAMRPITAMIEKAFETGGILTGKTFPTYLNTPSGKAVFRFDVRNSRAEKWLREQSSSLVVDITEDARTNIRTVITAGMQEGRNPRNVALDIVGRIDQSTGHRVGGVVGLTTPQEYWVRNTRQKLIALDPTYFDRALRDKRFDRTVQAAIDSGKPLPADVVEKLVLRYKDNALKYRGEMIGRTEAMQSLNASEYEATLQAVDLGATKAGDVQREWDSAHDNRVRWSHRVLNGQKVGLSQPFVSPSGARMMHPGDTSLGAGGSEVIGCRCRARTIVNWLAGIT